MYKKLFLSGFMQVYFVAVNTSFLISWIWSGNVKRVAFGSDKDRIVYSLGAATGGVIGVFFGVFISKL